MKKFDIFKKVSFALALAVLVATTGVFVACQQEEKQPQQEEEIQTVSAADVASAILLAAAKEGQDMIVTVRTDGTVQCRPASGVVARLKSDSPESSSSWAEYGTFCRYRELVGVIAALHSGNNGACYEVRVETVGNDCYKLSHKLC